MDRNQHKLEAPILRISKALPQAQTEIERYKAEREKAFKDNETKNVGSKDDIAAKIEADTKVNPYLNKSLN